jgi:hypothetical protein
VAKQIIQNCVVIISSSTVTTNAVRATLTMNADEVDTTAFGQGYRSAIGGLTSGSLSIDFHNDYAAGAIDSIVAPLVGSTAAFEIRPASTAAASSANPKYTGTVLVTEYSPIDSAVGDLSTFSVTWPVVSAVTRGTS